MVPNNRIRRFLPGASNPDPPISDRFSLTLPSASRPAQDSEEARIYAQLYERLAAVHRGRRGLWSRMWHFIWGD